MIPWNFAKFLVDEQGHVKKYWGPKSDPIDDCAKDIKDMLPASPRWLNGPEYATLWIRNLFSKSPPCKKGPNKVRLYYYE